MSIPNFVNCWSGIYPHMTLSEKMKCKMAISLHYAFEECDTLDKNNSSKLQINQSVTFVVENIVKKGIIIHSDTKGLVVQGDESDIIDGEDEDEDENEDKHTFIVRHKKILPYQVGDRVYACITIDDEDSRQKNTNNSR